MGIVLIYLTGYCKGYNSINVYEVREHLQELHKLYYSFVTHVFSFLTSDDIPLNRQKRKKAKGKNSLGKNLIQLRAEENT